MRAVTRFPGSRMVTHDRIGERESLMSWLGRWLPIRTRPSMSAFSKELPFPNCGNSASAELLKEYYRPQPVIPGFPVGVRDAATSDVHVLQSVLTPGNSPCTGVMVKVNLSVNT